MTATDQAISFQFAPTVPVVEIRDTLLLARWATESLFGADRVRIEAPFRLNGHSRLLNIVTTSVVGRVLARIIHGFARREYGNRVRVVPASHQSHAVSTGD